LDQFWKLEPEGTVRCKFWGYGSDGTVGANKNSITIIGDNTDLYAQGYFEYDSKKSGGVTIPTCGLANTRSNLNIWSIIADFIALHKPAYIGRYDVLEGIRPGGVFLLNSVWKRKKSS